MLSLIYKGKNASPFVSNIESKNSFYTYMSLFSLCRSGIYQLEIVSFCAIFYSNTNSIKLFCVNSSLNSGNFTNRLIFVIMSWKFDPRAKIFYPNVICDFCDKFHVCLFVPLSHVFHVAYVISFYQVFFIFHWSNCPLCSRGWSTHRTCNDVVLEKASV